MIQGPQLAFSDELHATKYRGKGEVFREAMNRIASALTDDDDHYKAFRATLMPMRFLPAGRVQAAAGSSREVTPRNCYVSGTIEDSLVDGHGSIFQRLLEAAATMRQGGGIGYDFSTLRPALDLIKSQGTASSGPVSFMQAFDASCKTIASAGQRRGAQMAVLRVDHPDVETFIRAKQPSSEVQVLWDVVGAISDPTLRARASRALQQTLPLTAFNTSVAVTNYFMECLDTGRAFPLKFEGRTYREVDPHVLWELMMRATWDWAEPGVLFIDTINRMNNLWYCETIAATNPCGEQPLPPNGACLLGSFNLPQYLHKDGARTLFDWDQFAADIPVVVRAMDNLVDYGRYPLYEQEKEGRSKRRMGLGVTGLANCLEALGNPYGSPDFLKAEEAILHRLNRECYLASADIAQEKGSFQLYQEREYLQGEFIKTLDEDVQDVIRAHGIRNSHLTSIAPTGTISLCADNVSSGIEPVFAYAFDREIKTAQGPTTERVEDYGMRVLGIRGKRSADVTIDEHLAVLTVAARNVDSAVSKTCNVGVDVGWEEFKNVYIRAYKEGCKGCTTFRVEGRRLGILTVSEEDTAPNDTDVVQHASNYDEGAACYIDPVTGRKECE